MAEDTISQEAQARKTIDDLKAKLDAATEALRQAAVRDRLVEQFSKQGVANPFSVATRALSDFRDVTGDTPEADLAAKAKGWFEEQKAIFGGGTPSPEPQVAPPSPFAGSVQPNLTAPGLPPLSVPVVVGSQAYKEQWASKPVSEQIAAMREGTLVVPDKVKITQQEGHAFR